MRYLIIGNGVSGTTTAASIRERDADGEVVILTDEALPFYNRIRLIEYLAGGVDEKALLMYDGGWYDKRSIKLFTDARVERTDFDKREVYTDDGRTFEYHKLLIATGAKPIVPPIKGAGLEGVFVLRNIRDARAILEYSDRVGDVMIIGGGVLGLEAGASLAKRGKRVTVLEIAPRLLPRQTDPEAARILAARLETMGLSFIIGMKVDEIMGGGRIKAVRLSDGSTQNADMALLASGVRPEAGPFEAVFDPKAGGITVNDRMMTSIEGVYASGDVALHRGVRYGIWQAAMMQGRAAGANMAGGEASYVGTPISHTLKIAGVGLASAGDTDPGGEKNSFVMSDERTYTYGKIVVDGNRVVGCILLGDIPGMHMILKAVTEKQDIGTLSREIKGWNIRATSR